MKCFEFGQMHRRKTERNKNSKNVALFLCGEYGRTGGTKMCSDNSYGVHATANKVFWDCGVGDTQIRFESDAEKTAKKAEKTFLNRGQEIFSARAL